MLKLYKVNKWWKNLEKYKKVKICLNYNAHSISDDYWQQYDWRFIRIIKMNIKLTKKSKEQLHNQNNGTGVIFIKEDNNTTIIIEFYLGSNGKYYCMGNCPPSIELYKNLDEIKPELMYCINKEATNVLHK